MCFDAAPPIHPITTWQWRCGQRWRRARARGLLARRRECCRCNETLLVVLVCDEPLAEQVRDFHRQPRAQLHPVTIAPSSITHTPSAKACAIPKCGTLRAHSGLKWSVRQILPPLHARILHANRFRMRKSHRYILAVLPSSSGMAISGAVVGYVTGICGS